MHAPSAPLSSDEHSNTGPGRPGRDAAASWDYYPIQTLEGLDTGAATEPVCGSYAGSACGAPSATARP